MTIRFPAILITTLCIVSGTAQGDDLSFTDSRTQSELLTINHSTPLFAGRWCILTFIDDSRNFDAVSTHGYRSAAFRSVVRSSYSLPGGRPTYADESSLVSRLKALRTLRMMTLWQGRDSALVFGLDESGYIGIRLDEAVVHTY